MNINYILNNNEGRKTSFCFLGNHVVFVYPDMVTVLLGRFEKGKMIAAKPSVTIAERCHKGIKEIKIRHPRSNATIFKYSRPDRLRIGNQPKVMDPFTKKNIYIGDGTKDDGVFARRDIKKGELVMYYSGLFWPT